MATKKSLELFAVFFLKRFCKETENELRRRYIEGLEKQIKDKEEVKQESPPKSKNQLGEKIHNKAKPTLSTGDKEQEYLDECLSNTGDSDKTQSMDRSVANEQNKEQDIYPDKSIEQNPLDIYSGYAETQTNKQLKQNTIRLNFRTDNAFMSLAEVEAKQQRSKQLQANLMQQIEEKRQRMEQEKRKHLEDEQRDQQRILREIQALNDKHEMQVIENKEKERRVSLKQDSVAEAWFQAKSESMKLRSSINRRSAGDSCLTATDNNACNSSAWKAELIKLQESVAQDKIEMQRQLEENFLSLSDALMTQLNDIKLKTDILENKTAFSSIELNDMQQKVKWLQSTPNKALPALHSITPTSLRRICSARKTDINDLQLSLWDMGLTDFTSLFHTADLKSHVNEDDSNAFQETTLYCYPNGQCKSRPNTVVLSHDKQARINGHQQDALDEFIGKPPVGNLEEPEVCEQKVPRERTLSLQNFVTRDRNSASLSSNDI